MRRITIENHLPDHTPVNGCCCDTPRTLGECEDVEDAALTPGDACPAGRCPECEGLVYVVTEKSLREDASAGLLDLCLRAADFLADRVAVQGGQYESELLAELRAGITIAKRGKPDHWEIHNLAAAPLERVIFRLLAWGMAKSERDELAASDVNGIYVLVPVYLPPADPAAETVAQLQRFAAADIFTDAPECADAVAEATAAMERAAGIITELQATIAKGGAA